MNQSYWLLIGSLLLCSWLLTVESRSSGPALETTGNPSNFQYACQALQPHPTFHSGATAGTGGYELTITPTMETTANGFTYIPDQVYNIVLSHESGSQSFRGFLVQARVPGNTPNVNTPAMLLGTFATGGVRQQTLDCDSTMGTMDQAAISHQNVAGEPSFTSVSFTWTAPSTPGSVNFYYTVVQLRTTHFDAINARSLVVTPTTEAATTQQATTQAVTGTGTQPGDTTEAFTGTGTRPQGTTEAFTGTGTQPQGTTEAFTGTGTRPQGTTEAFTGTGTRPQPAGPPAPTRGDNQYRLRIVDPPSCVPPLCNFFAGIDTNAEDSNFLDIVLEGRVEGWLAVGFSDTSNMFSADVVACNRFEDDIVALDAWNLPSPTRFALTDAMSEDDVRLFSSSFNNGVLRCTISKRIAPGAGQDLDLSQDLFILSARRSSASGQLNQLDSHPATERSVTMERFNPSSSAAVIGRDRFDAVHRPNLIRAHGILMIIAWPILAVTAIFFALLMRPALPNGEWFQVHRAFMIVSLVLTTIAFVLIFIALKNNGGRVVGSGLSLAHMIIGIFILLLQIINPIIAIFRCGPKDNKRWIFNLFHGSLIGFAAETLAFVNVAFGLSIFSSLFSTTFELTRAPLFVYLAFCVFYFVIVVAGVILFAVYACKTGNKACAPSVAQGFVKEKNGDYAVEMTSNDPEKKEAIDEEKPRKEPSKDSPLRWGWLAVYLAISVPLLLAVIIMVAFP